MEKTVSTLNGCGTFLDKLFSQVKQQWIQAGTGPLNVVLVASLGYFPGMASV